MEHAVNAGNSQSGDRHDRKPPRTDRKDFTSGVVGVSINRQGSSDEPGMEETDDLSLEDVSPQHQFFRSLIFQLDISWALGVFAGSLEDFNS